MRTILLLISCMVSTFLVSQDITGTWNGALEVLPGNQLSIVFHVVEEGDGYVTTMDSPDQGALGIPTDSTSYVDGRLIVTINSIQAKYEGQWSATQDSLIGTFSQGPASFPLVLTRDAPVVEKIVRPQDPVDFPYTQEEVSFINPKGGHTLAGTLTTPKSGEFSVVEILITGSGPQNRDSELLNHRPFLVLSDYLTRGGVATLRYDDRGVADSGGDHGTATSADFADDVAAAISYLRSRPDMADKKIGLAGHSEGGIIAPMVAAEHSEVDHIILLAGPGIDISELLILQGKKLSTADGASQESIEANTRIQKLLFGFLKDNPNLKGEEYKSQLKEKLEEAYEFMPEESQAQSGGKEAFMKGQGGVLMGDWFRFFLSHDPQATLAKVDCPILAVNGSLDLQVTSEENLAGIKEATAHNDQVTIKEFPKLNHLFQTAVTGSFSEYAKIEETFNEEVMSYVLEWIGKL